MSIYMDPNLPRQENIRRDEVKNDTYGIAIGMYHDSSRFFPVDPERNRENWANCIKTLIPITCGVLCCPCAATRIFQHIRGNENPQDTCGSWSPKMCRGNQSAHYRYGLKQEGDSCSDLGADMASVAATITYAVGIPLLFYFT